MDYERMYKDLREQMEAQREREERRYRQEQDQRDRERRERLEQARFDETTAGSWEEAFRKSIPRIAREAADEHRMNEEMRNDPDMAPYALDDFFMQWLQVVKLAQTVWREENHAIQDRIQRIRARAERLIEALEQQAREKAANRVDAEHPDNDVSEALRNDDYSFLVDW